MGAQEGLSAAESLPYACIGVFSAGIIYFVLAGLIAAFGAKKVMRFFPPIVTGPIIIAIGLTLSGSAIQNCNSNWWIALLAIAIIVVCNICGKGMIRIIPILLGVLGSYLVAACFGLCDFSAVKDAAWFGAPFQWENTAFHVFQNPSWGLIVSAIIAIVPISLATMMEHIGDMCAISSTTGINYLEDPGLHRTLMGDTIGGVSLVLYGMISAVGVRNIVENQVDFTKSRNVLVAALILVLAIGIKYGAGDAIDLGFTKLSGLAVAALVGVILNAILPGKDYEFGANPNGDKAVDFEINPSLRK